MDRATWERFGIGARLDKDVARAAGRSCEAVRQARVRLGIPRPVHPRVAARDVKIAEALRQDRNRAISDLASVCGIPRNSVIASLKRQGLKPGIGDSGKGRRKHTVAEIIAAVRECGCVTSAARLLGYHPVWLHRLMGGSGTGARGGLRALVPGLPDGRRKKR